MADIKFEIEIPENGSVVIRAFADGEQIGPMKSISIKSDINSSDVFLELFKKDDECSEELAASLTKTRDMILSNSKIRFSEIPIC